MSSSPCHCNTIAAPHILRSLTGGYLQIKVTLQLQVQNLNPRSSTAAL